MSRLWDWTKHEIRELAPIVLYFFVSLNVIGFTRGLLLRDYGVATSTFVAATIGALVMGKVAIVVEILPFMQPFPMIPIMYNALWKTLVYYVGAFGFQALEDLIKDRSLDPFIKELSSPKFWSVQMALVLVILGFCVFRQLSEALGPGKMRHYFFGTAHANAGKD